MMNVMAYFMLFCRTVYCGVSSSLFMLNIRCRRLLHRNQKTFSVQMSSNPRYIFNLSSPIQLYSNPPSTLKYTLSNQIRVNQIVYHNESEQSAQRSLLVHSVVQLSVSTKN